ncbi:hypothetical protein Cni_G08988 [Canna indica]|uniref:Uncharacterized protein n=1 Tax=Canna indica TaxID=4628 RepID=A0AAQ3K3E5_9LILI|nr:hypothetical protein Cni_G08988 [Canna indica]
MFPRRRLVHQSPLGHLFRVLRLGSYLVAVADAELGLLLGDMCAEFVRRTFEGVAPPPIAAECSAMSRMECVRRGVSMYATKATLGGGGRGQRERGGLGAEHLRGREEGGGRAEAGVELSRESGDSCGWVDGRRDDDDDDDDDDDG